jgi:CDP-diacylglycerol--serine O-phosphatidyltransferase
MNAIKRNIPNIITLANLTCGLFAIFFAFEGNLVLSATFIFYGAFFDFFDGLLARILKVGSEFGKQLDSLADMVTFGVAPGMILFQLIYNSTVNSFSQSDITQPNFFPSIIAFLIPIFSA